MRKANITGQVQVHKWGSNLLDVRVISIQSYLLWNIVMHRRVLKSLGIMYHHKNMMCHAKAKVILAKVKVTDGVQTSNVCVTYISTMVDVSVLWLYNAQKNLNITWIMNHNQNVMCHAKGKYHWPSSRSQMRFKFTRCLCYIHTVVSALKLYNE